MKFSMAAMRSLTLVKVPRRIAWRVMMPKKISTPRLTGAQQTDTIASLGSAAAHCESPGYDVFLTFMPADRALAKSFSDQLRTFGVSVWDSEEQVQIGSSITHEIDNGLQNSKFAVLLITVNWLSTSRWTELELESLLRTTALTPVGYNLPSLELTGLQSVLDRFARLDASSDKTLRTVAGKVAALIAAESRVHKLGEPT